MAAGSSGASQRARRGCARCPRPRRRSTCGSCPGARRVDREGGHPAGLLRGRAGLRGRVEELRGLPRNVGGSRTAISPGRGGRERVAVSARGAGEGLGGGPAGQGLERPKAGLGAPVVDVVARVGAVAHLLGRRVARPAPLGLMSVVALERGLALLLALLGPLRPRVRNFVPLRPGRRALSLLRGLPTTCLAGRQGETEDGDDHDENRWTRSHVWSVSSIDRAEKCRSARTQAREWLTPVRPGQGLPPRAARVTRLGYKPVPGTTTDAPRTKAPDGGRLHRCVERGVRIPLGSRRWLLGMRQAGGSAAANRTPLWI